MEVIINQIRSVLDKPTQRENFIFDEKTISYNAQLNERKKIFYGYYFDLRRKMGSSYYLLNISLRINNKSISDIANSIKIEAINSRENVPASVKKSLIKDIKKNQTLTGIYEWSELDEIFLEEITIWSCSINSLEELFNYPSQLLILFEKGQEWVKNLDNWDFIIEWAFNHNNVLQALSILKYLDRKEEFYLFKKAAFDKYEKKKYPTDEIKIISI